MIPWPLPPTSSGSATPSRSERASSAQISRSMPSSVCLDLADARRRRHLVEDVARQDAEVLLRLVEGEVQRV